MKKIACIIFYVICSQTAFAQTTKLSNSAIRDFAVNAYLKYRYGNGAFTAFANQTLSIHGYSRIDVAIKMENLDKEIQVVEYLLEGLYNYSGNKDMLFMQINSLGVTATNTKLIVDYLYKRHSTVSANTKSESESSNTSQKYIVMVEKAFFHSKPQLALKGKAYLIKGQTTFTNSRQSDDFIYCNYTNGKGVTTKGWLRKSDLKKMSDNDTNTDWDNFYANFVNAIEQKDIARIKKLTVDDFFDGGGGFTIDEWLQEIVFIDNNSFQLFKKELRGEITEMALDGSNINKVTGNGEAGHLYFVYKNSEWKFGGVIGD